MKHWILSVAVVGLTLQPCMSQNEQTPLQIASLSTVLTDLAKQVGGDAIEVTPIVKAGMDPHGFEPTVRDVKTMADAQIVLASGMGFEPYLAKLKTSIGKQTELVIVGDAVNPLMVDASALCTDHGHDHDHGHSHAGEKAPDPHWWHSVSNVKTAAKTLRDAFIKADPANRARYEANTKAYLARLDALEKWIRLEVAKVPRKARILVTSHDALGYFADNYAFEVHPVQGISTSEQPSSKQVRALIDTIKADNVKAIFAENIENPKILSEITRETGARLGGTLYADGLGQNEAATYEEMMRHNVSTIVTALQ
jgi:zinc/manganese transport system substrate-binding protein